MTEPQRNPTSGRCPRRRRPGVGDTGCWEAPGHPNKLEVAA